MFQCLDKYQRFLVLAEIGYLESNLMVMFLFLPSYPYEEL